MEQIYDNTLIFPGAHSPTPVIPRLTRNLLSKKPAYTERRWRIKSAMTRLSEELSFGYFVIRDPNSFKKAN